MKYRDIMGYSNKQPKKKVVKEVKKPTVVDAIKEEFGLNEGPAYEYANYVKKIEKSFKVYQNSVEDLVDLLNKKGLKKQGNMFSRSFMKQVRKWNDFFNRQMRKLI